ncbi:MAG: hypothetical protein ABSF43_02720 [Rectinemataceae bacterium]
MLAHEFAHFAGEAKPKEAQGFFAAVEAAIEASPGAREAAALALRSQAEDPLNTHPSFAARTAALPELAGSVPAEATRSVPHLEGEGRRLSELAVRKFGIELADEGEYPLHASPLNSDE